ncbi:GM17725 [Drosophila sechellia]|uniref:GM17725 n=1 Tax=Drosophila sechellia TaxID=7238 RepID=B4IJL8_DROSE|nr:GM17725 [Drosophila sechellia]
MTEETETVPMPTWLKADLFEELLSKRYGGNYAGIKSFKPEAGLKPGENYSTIMLRLKFEVELKGYHIAFILCPPVLLDRTEEANLTDFVTETDNGDGLKMAMYSNARYKKHVSAILKWLNNRGAVQF